MMRALHTSRDAWDGFWFAPERALNLAAARVILCLHSLWIVLSRNFADIADVAPVWTFTSAQVKWRFLLVPGHASVDGVLQWCAISALVLGVLGIYPRVSCLVAGLLLYHLAPLETAFRDVTPYGRGLTLAPVGLLLMAASPSSDVLAPGRGLGLNRPPSGDYAWALRLAQLLVCQIYLFAAYGKLVAAGLAWGSAESMRLWLIWANIDPLASTFHVPGLWLADQPSLLLSVLGMGTLALEAGVIVALFRHRTRWWLIPATLLFNVALVVTINAHVPEVWLIFLFVNWHAVAVVVSRPRPSRLGGDRAGWPAQGGIELDS